MNNYNILINGLTDSASIPKNLRFVPHCNVCETNSLKLSNKIYGIAKILAIDINVSIKSLKKTQYDNKHILNIIGFKNLTITYISNKKNNEVHKVKYKIPFSSHIPCTNENFNLKKVYVAIEKVSIKLNNSRNIVINSSIFIAPLIKNNPITKPKENYISNYKNNTNSSMQLAQLFILLILVYKLALFF